MKKTNKSTDKKCRSVKSIRKWSRHYLKKSKQTNPYSQTISTEIIESQKRKRKSLDQSEDVNISDSLDQHTFDEENVCLEEVKALENQFNDLFDKRFLSDAR